MRDFRVDISYSLGTLSTEPKLLARGTLAQTSLPEFLIHAYDRNLEGTLILQTADGQKSALYFTRGAPAKARLAADNVFLADVVVELGLVDRKESVRTQKRAEENKRTHGEVLVEERLIDQTGLYVALREQIRQQVLELCRLPLGTGFGFYDVNFLAKWGPSGEWRIKPLPLFWRALVDHEPADKVAKLVEKVGQHPLKLRLEAPIARYRMASEESAIIDVLRAKPQPLGALRAFGVGPEKLVDRVVAALLLSRQLEGFSTDHEPVGLHEPPESPQSLPPPGPAAAPTRGSTAPRRTMTPSGRSSIPMSQAAPSSEVANFRAEIEAFVAAPSHTYYELLEIPQEADTSAVRAAFFRLARKWHPDRLPSDLEDLKPAVSKAFARMNEAHQVLSDPARRREYDEKFQGAATDDETAKVTAILEAAGAYQRAEVLMKKRDYAAALVEARAAYEGDETQADYVALYAWLESLGRTDQVADLIALLDRALSLDANNVRALWYRGQLLKKSGKLMQAVRDFRAIIEIKPSHVDAQRELRVYEMRKRTDGGVKDSPKGDRGTGSTARATTAPKGATEPPKPGLFGRLLKKD